MLSKIRALKRSWPAVLALVVGTVIFGVAYAWQETSRAETTAAVEVPVLNRNIAAYEVITAENLELKAIKEKALDANTARDISAVLGKTAASTLYKGMPIDVRDLRSDLGGLLKDRQIVTVNMDYCRSAGVTAGDIVDVYWVNPEQSAWTPDSESARKRIAAEAIVLGVKNKTGSGLEAVVKGDAGGIGVVELAVRPAEAPNVVAGSLPQDTHVVLVKKPVPAAEKGGTPVVPDEKAGPADPNGSQ